MAYNKFAESVINGAYKRKETRDNTSSQSNNSFADSVINGTYKKIEIDTTPRQIVTSPPVQINTAKETIQAQTQPVTQPVTQPTTEPQKTPLVYEGASINPNASEEEKLRIIANNNLRQKQEAYNKTYEDLKSKRKEELTKQGISTDPMVKYNEATLSEKLTKPSEAEAKTLADESRKYISSREDLENATQNESQDFSNANNQLKYAKYLKNVSDVQQEDTNIVDQTLGNLTRGALDILSNFSEDNRFVDENGNVQYLPSYNALKQQKVQESYGNGFLGDLARFAGDVGYQGGKIGASIGLNALAPYSGTALYFSDIYGDQYQQNINEGMDNETAMLNAFAKTGQNYVKQWLIGGLGGKILGKTDASWLEKTLSSEWAKVASDPRVVSILSSMSAEALDEFTDTYMETLIDAFSKKDSNLGDLLSTDTLLEALYSAAVGGATGATGGLNANSMATAQNAINQRAMGNIDNQQNITPQNTNTQIQPETPQIQTNQENNINNQEQAKQLQIELNEANNNVQNNKVQNVEQDLINEINNEQRKLDNGTSEDDGFHLAELQKELQEVQKKSIASDSNTFNLGKINENTTLNNLRSSEDISNKKVNAYQYDNPEVKPFFKDAAYDLKSALENFTTKGERRTYEDGTWGGTKFNSTPEITELKEKYNMSYKDLDRGIEGIIRDTGKENNAASKKVELVIDKMLRKGYRSETPDTITPNQQYLDTISGKQIDNETNQELDGELPFYLSGEETKTPVEQNDNIPERKSDSELLAIKKEETVKRIADDLNKSIKKENNSSQDFDSLRKEIEKETGKPMRSYIETFTKGTGTTDLVQLMDKERITYDRTSKEKVTKEANKTLNGLNYDEKIGLAKGIIHSDKRLKATDIAILTEVAKEANRLGKMNDVMELAQDMSMLETEGGQVVWAASLIKNSDPLSQLTMLRKIIDKEQSRGNKIYDGVKIKEDLVNDVVNSYNEDGTWNKETFDKAMDKLKQDIVDQMKVRPTEKLNAWRYLSMLGNPKTHIRNIVANYAMMLLQGSKDKIASGIESITPMNALNNLLNTKVKWNGLKPEIKKGNTEATRGHTLRKSTQEVKNFANTTMENYFNENEQSSKYTENSGVAKNDLEKRRKMFRERTFIGKGLNWANKKNDTLLTNEDVKFNKKAAKKAFANFLTANGIETKEDIEANPDLVAQAQDYALFRGQEATFHQYSRTGEMLRNARESLRGGKGLDTNYTMLNKASSNLSKAGGLLMDATMPFINTPINIAKTGIEYTPGIGVVKLISDVKNAPKDLKADVLIDGLSKHFTGGVLAALGYGLAELGVINAKGGEDKEDKLEKNLGRQDYSWNIFGNTIDLSWLSPSAMPLFIGAELQKATSGKGIDIESAMSLLSSTIDPLSEMSVISSVTDALKSYSQGSQALGDIGTSAITSYLMQYIPTLSSQIATVFDETQRSSSGNTLGEKIKNQAMYKLPGLRNMLPAQVDVWGEEKKYSENPIIRFAEAFFSPANRKQVKIDDTTKEIERVYENTGSGLPSLSITKTPKIDDVTYNLNSKEYIQYKKDYGKNAKDMLDDLVKQDKYKNADDAEKASMISAIYQYSTYMARKKIAEENNMKFEYKQSDGKGYNFPKYYLSLSKDEFAKYIANKNNK